MLGEESENDEKENEESNQKIISEYIEKNINQIKDFVILVFIEDVANKNTLFKTIEKYGMIHDFQKLKPNELIKKLKLICNTYQVNVNESTLLYFIEMCGTNMQVLINEIRKLIEYVGKDGTIKKEDIDKLSIKELESKIFDLTDNLGKKSTKKALEILKELVYNKEPVQKILITLYNHFKKLYVVKLSEKYNRNISDTLVLKPTQTFLIPRYKKQASYFKEQELRKLLTELIELDNKSKSGLLDLNIGLEAVLCTYC